jgi:glutamate-1-semialdehyde 2,1-aminomutase
VRQPGPIMSARRVVYARSAAADVCPAAPLIGSHAAIGSHTATADTIGVMVATGTAVGLEARYRAARGESQRLWERACGVFPQGVSGAAKLYPPYPVFIASAKGSRAVDVDGNEYVDLLMGAGPMLLGHGHPTVLAAVREQLERMTNPMLPSERSIELAERIRGHMPYLERLRFTNTGSEATRSAVRVARAVTGRPLIAKCEGAFHGSDDMFLISGHTRAPAGDAARPEPVHDYAGLLPGVEQTVLVLPYNDPRAAAELIAEHASELAAVIFEPVAFSSGGGVPATREFAAALREATSRHDVLLIFDEVLCAYRMGLAGAPAYLGVSPDLSAIGKAIGGGLALAAFGGRAELMETALPLIEQGDPPVSAGRGTTGAHRPRPTGSFPGSTGSLRGSTGALHGPAGAHPPREIFQSGTFTENPLAIAAGLAVLDVLESEPVLERADRAGRLLREGLAAQFAAHGVIAAVTGAASILQAHIGVADVTDRRDVLRADERATCDFLLGMLAGGVLWPPGHPAVTSGAHTDQDVERVVATTGAVLSGE